jgi:hypothetical protein
MHGVTTEVETPPAIKPSKQAEKLYMENTLLRVAGALFCHDAKAAASRTAEITLNGGTADKQIVVRPDPRQGQPGPLAHKVFVAIIKKHSNYGREVRSEVSFTKREIMRIIGRSAWGGRDSRELARALQQIQFTFIRASFKAGEQTWREHTFNIFPEVLLERQEDHADAPIESCTVTLARPIVASLQDNHFICLNDKLMRELGTIGQALYMRLFFHFANLYDGHHKNRLSFRKRYDDLCAEWLGGLTVRDRISHIDRDQLGPHLRDLARLGFLGSYRIDRAASGKGFVLTFRPGAQFFTDYAMAYRRRASAAVTVEIGDDNRAVAEPLKVAYLFHEKRTGQPAKNIAYVPSKDVGTAKELLTHIPLVEMPKFIAYGLAEANKTKFEVQTLGGLKQYLSGYQEARRQRDRHQAGETAAKARRLNEEAIADAYAAYRRSAAEALYQTLPEGERTTIDELARGTAGWLASGLGSTAEIMLRLARARITADRHPEAVLTFEQWQERANAA